MGIVYLLRLAYLLVYEHRMDRWGFHVPNLFRRDDIPFSFMVEYGSRHRLRYALLYHVRETLFEQD